MLTHLLVSVGATLCGAPATELTTTSPMFVTCPACRDALRRRSHPDRTAA